MKRLNATGSLVNQDLLWLHHIIKFSSDETSQPRANATVSWEDEHTLGDKSSSVNCNDDHFILNLKPILQSTPESNIPHRRKAGTSSNVFETNEGLTMNRMSDRKSPTYIRLFRTIFRSAIAC